MKDKAVKIAKVVCFCALTVLIVCFFNSLFKPKWLETRWQSSKTNKSFYDLEKDSIDVALIGSSVIAAAYDPFQLYEEHGISSYNFGVMQQPMIGSYFWLCECLKTQSPQLVVLDVRTVGRKDDRNEADARKSYDYLRPSLNKLKYAIEYCSEEKDASFLEYLFPLAKYHTRWTEIDEEDFDFVMGNNKSLTRGFVTLTRRCGTSYEGFDVDTDETKKYNKLNLHYLKRIIQLCQEEDIDLLLVRNPDPSWSVKKHNYVNNIAKEYDLPYLDFNVADLLEEVGIDYAADGADLVHLNMSGAKKITTYLGKYLEENYDLPDRKGTAIGEQIETEEEMYQYAYADAQLGMVTDLDEFLAAAGKDCYSLILANGAGLAGTFSESQQEALEKLHISQETQEALRSEKNVIAVIDQGEETLLYDDSVKEIQAQGGTIEQAEILEKQGYLNDGALYSATSTKDGCAIQIGSEECKVNPSGVSIAVYDQVIHQVADTIYLGTAEDGQVLLGR